MNFNSMLYWWPLVQDVARAPKTEFVVIDPPAEAVSLASGCRIHQVEHGWDEIKPDCEPPIYAYKDEILAAAARIGYPLFMKTDLTSGKHTWDRSCFVREEANFMHHVNFLLEEHECALGFERDAPVRAIVLREFLTLDSAFKAFEGMPISRERRYFVEGGRVLCHHPYWPEEAMRFWSSKEPDNWRAELARLNTETEAEMRTLSVYASNVSHAMARAGDLPNGGQWSVDFALNKEDGNWYLIDMALAEQSWHPDHE